MPRVLVIDDDEDIAAVTALMLESGGHEVAIELDERKAMERIAAFHPELIVLDVMFPGNSTAGFDLARQIRSQDQTLPIVMLTSVNDHGSPKFGNQDRDPVWLPISEFIEKPIKKPRLLELVRSLVKKQEQAVYRK
jgi:CheY-like chemotaxis protein